MIEQELVEKIARRINSATGINKWDDCNQQFYISLADEILAYDVKEADWIDPAKLKEWAEANGYKSPEEVKAIYDSCLRANSYTASATTKLPEK